MVGASLRSTLTASFSLRDFPQYAFRSSSVSWSCGKESLLAWYLRVTTEKFFHPDGVVPAAEFMEYPGEIRQLLRILWPDGTGHWR